MRIVLSLILLFSASALAEPANTPKAALAEAKRLGKPLLILVASIDPKRRGFSSALGALLNHGPPTLVDAMTRYHVVGMGHVFLRRIGIEANAYAYSIEQTGALVVRTFDAPLPKRRDTNDDVMESLEPFASKFEHFLRLIGEPDPDPSARERILAGPLPGIVWGTNGDCVDPSKLRPTDRRPKPYSCGLSGVRHAPTQSQEGVYCRTPSLLLDWQTR